MVRIVDDIIETAICSFVLASFKRTHQKRNATSQNWGPNIGELTEPMLIRNTKAEIISWKAECLRGQPTFEASFFTIFFLSEIFILPFQVFYIMLYGYWSIRENFFSKFWRHPAELWPAEWSTIFSLSARFLMFGWSETVNPYLFFNRAWMVIVPSKIVKFRL